jgi:hypothetical protein
MAQQQQDPKAAPRANTVAAHMTCHASKCLCTVLYAVTLSLANSHGSDGDNTDAQQQECPQHMTGGSSTQAQHCALPSPKLLE